MIDLIDSIEISYLDRLAKRYSHETSTSNRLVQALLYCTYIATSYPRQLLD